MIQYILPDFFESTSSLARGLTNDRVELEPVQARPGLLCVRVR